MTDDTDTTLGNRGDWLGWKSVGGAAAICIAGLGVGFLIFQMLSKQIGTLDTTVTSMDSRVGDIDTRLAVIESKIQTLQTSLDNQQSSTAEALLRIESTLGDLTLRIDGPSSLINPGLTFLPENTLAPAGELAPSWIPYPPEIPYLDDN